MSRWLRAADGTQCINENFTGVNQDFSINEGKDLRRNVRGVEVNQNINPNLIPLGCGQVGNSSRPNKGRSGGNELWKTDGLVSGAMELVSNEEDTQLLCWKEKNGRELWKVHGFLWMLSWGQDIWIFRLALVTRAVKIN
ncbi:hypothetical protein Gotur_002279, partial [Gossypium turneri]